MSNSLQPHGLKQAWLPCPSTPPGVCSNSRPLTRCYHTSHTLSPPSPPALSLTQHQGLLQWVGSLHQVAKVLEPQLQRQSFQWISRVDFLQDSLIWSAAQRILKTDEIKGLQALLTSQSCPRLHLSPYCYKKKNKTLIKSSGVETRSFSRQKFQSVSLYWQSNKASLFHCVQHSGSETWFGSTAPRGWAFSKARVRTHFLEAKEVDCSEGGVLEGGRGNWDFGRWKDRRKHPLPQDKSSVTPTSAWLAVKGSTHVTQEGCLPHW